MIRKIGFIGICLIALSLGLSAQTVKPLEEKAFNFGGKVGLNADFPIINSFTADGKEVDNLHIQYKVGYLASLFCRINIERFFIQPCISLHHSSGDIYFTLPTSDQNDSNTNNSTSNCLSTKFRSVEMPIMIGYHFIRQGPYGLSLMLGPKLKYNYKNSYTSTVLGNWQSFESDNTPFGVNVAAGVGVSIWRLFFDFVYEFGVNQEKSDFIHKVTPTTLETPHKFCIDRRINVMSFSLGFLF